MSSISWLNNPFLFVICLSVLWAICVAFAHDLDLSKALRFVFVSLPMKIWYGVRWFLGGCSGYKWQHDWEYRTIDSTNIRVCKNCYKIQQQYPIKIYNTYNMSSFGIDNNTDKVNYSIAWYWDDIETFKPGDRVISPLPKKKVFKKNEVL
jgi:hypothetical protein